VALLSSKFQRKASIFGISETDCRHAAFDEASTLIDPSEKGHFAVLYGVYDTNGNLIDKRQHCYPNQELHRVIQEMPIEKDAWISQAKFWNGFSRKKKYFLNVSAIWVDIDYYKIEGMSDELALMVVHDKLADFGFPFPSTIVHSGKGLQVKWLLSSSITKKQLLVWHHVQNRLHEWFKNVGSDPASLDESRVLRVAGTYHTKAKALVSLIGGSGERYDFEYLGEHMHGIDLDLTDDHPYTQEEKAKKTAAREWRAAQPTKKTFKQKLTVLEGGKTSVKRGFSNQSLNWDRFNDLLTLHKLRDGNMDGVTMCHLFYCLNFMALSGAITSSELLDRAGTLCNQLGLGHLTRSNELTTLLSKLQAKEMGKTEPFAGVEWTPMYTPKNVTLINLFCITDEEQRQLKTIISCEEKKRRRSAKLFKTDRATYLSVAAQKRDQAILMKAEGLNSSTICEKLSISRMTLSRYLSAAV
jgi:hypothetical protein